MSAESAHEMVVEEDQSKKMEEEKPIAVAAIPAVEETSAVPQASAIPVEAPVVVAAAVVTEEPAVVTTEKVVTEVPAVATNPVVVEAPQEVVLPDQHITKVYNFGSTEMDQFWLPGQRSETRRPYLDPVLTKITVAKVACGSLHILILSDQGRVYSSGQNDDGALGRPDESSTDEESDKKTKLVDIPIRVNMISAGDSHSVAANSELGVCFQWGTYRNTEKSNLAPPARAPVQVGQKEFQKKKFSKLLSGQQHTLVLTDEGEVFCWGDPDMGVVGRMPRTRHGYEQALKVAKVTHNKAVDIYTGGRHCFMKRILKKATTAADGTVTQPVVGYFAWGLNNFGQLGINLPKEENLDVVFDPIKIDFFDNLDVIQISGGESHSLALTSDGTLYGFGRNDIGQFGLGAPKSTHAVYGELAENYAVPTKIDTLPADTKKIVKSWSGPNYCYAQDESGQNFSWGFGSNFVLGNRKDEDEDEFTPYTIPRDFFKNEIPYNFALGSQHVSYWVNLTDAVPTVDSKLLLDAPAEYLPAHLRPKVVKAPITALGRAKVQKEQSSQSKSDNQDEEKEKNSDKGTIEEEKKDKEDNKTSVEAAEKPVKKVKKEEEKQDKVKTTKTATKKRPASRSASSNKKTDASRSKSKEPKKKTSESKGRSKSKETKKTKTAEKKSSSKAPKSRSRSKKESKSASKPKTAKSTGKPEASSKTAKTSNKKKPTDDAGSLKTGATKIKVDATVSKK